MRQAGVAAQDAALNGAQKGGGDSVAQLAGRWRQALAPVGFNLADRKQPGQVAAEPFPLGFLDPGQNIRRVTRPQLDELQQQVDGSKAQHLTIGCARPMPFGQTVKPAKRLQAVEEHFIHPLLQRLWQLHDRGIGSRTAGFVNQAGQAKGGLLGAGQHGPQLVEFRQAATLAHPFNPAVVKHITAGRIGWTVKEAGFQLHAPHPDQPLFKGVVDGVDVVGGVAKDQIEQRADLVPQDPDVRLPRAVERHNQHHLVFWLDHRDANRVDHTDAFDRIRQQASRGVLMRSRARNVQQLQHAPDAGFVSDGVQ